MLKRKNEQNREMHNRFAVHWLLTKFTFDLFWVIFNASEMLPHLRRFISDVYPSRFTI